MKKYILLLSWLVLLVSCSSPARLIKNEHYDAAVEKLSRKLRSSKVRTQDVALLKQAYHAANQIDHDKIQLLKTSGSPDVWTEVYNRYRKMNQRQDKVRFLSAELLQEIGYQHTDYHQYIVEAQNNAANYLVARINQLLMSQLTSDARRALQLVDELQAIAPSNENISQLRANALLLAVNNVLIQFDNQSGIPVPDAFANDLMEFSQRDIQQSYVDFDFAPQRGITYDYVIYVSLKQIIASPERVDKRNFTEKREIQDGTEPKRDEKGNIVLDSTGKVIEVPRYIEVQAFVKETVLAKDMLVRLSVDFVDNLRNRNILSVPVERGLAFYHDFAIVNGDLRACTKATLEMMNREPIPFPPDAIMLMDVAPMLNQEVKRIIRREGGIVNKAID